MLKLELILDEGTGEWTVYAPNKHYRTCNHVSGLIHTVPKVIEDYANWIIKQSSIKHLEVDIKNGGHTMKITNGEKVDVR